MGWLPRETPFAAILNRPRECVKGGKADLSIIQRALVRDPMVPLVFRLIIWFFSSCAVALGCSIFMLSKRYKFSESPSTLMAIIFDTIALVYGFFITYDEYSGKPLGLRSPAAKMRLVLLDLFFIVFNSANLSLAFDSLSDTRGFCAARPAHEPDLAQLGVQNFVLCDRQRALAGVLLIALVAWLLTFSVSLFRSVIVASTNRPLLTMTLGWWSGSIVIDRRRVYLSVSSRALAGALVLDST